MVHTNHSLTRESGQPYDIVSNVDDSWEHADWTLTAVRVLLGFRRDAALVGLGKGLSLETGAGRAEAAVIHGMLEAVILPTKDVISVLGVAGSRIC